MNSASLRKEMLNLRSNELAVMSSTKIVNVSAKSRVRYLEYNNFSSSSNKRKVVKVENDEEDKVLISNIEGKQREELGKKPESLKLRWIPTRHSRLLPPPLASRDILDDVTKDILSAEVGSWYTYDPNLKIKDDEDGGETILGDVISDPFSQKVEFALRGHSTLVQGTIMQNSTDSYDQDCSMTVENRVLIMEQLLERMENEANAYREAYDKIHSTLTTEQELHSTAKPQTHEGKTTLGAPPGPTTAMYDLVLDAWAVSASPTALQRTRTLFDRAFSRHVLDGGAKNINRKTIPTSLTFNAVIRTAANTSYDDTNTSTENIIKRDQAIEAAFYMFDRMLRCDATKRNAATYVYMLQVVRKFIPLSRNRGSIARAFFALAEEEGVVDSNLVNQLKQNGGGLMYDEWAEKVLNMKVEEWPSEWKKNAKRLAYSQDITHY